MGFKCTVEVDIDVGELPSEVIDEIVDRFVNGSVDFSVWGDGIEVTLPMYKKEDIVLSLGYDKIESCIMDLAKNFSDTTMPDRAMKRIIEMADKFKVFLAEKGE